MVATSCKAAFFVEIIWVSENKGLLACLTFQTVTKTQMKTRQKGQVINKLLHM